MPENVRDQRGLLPAFDLDDVLGGDQDAAFPLRLHRQQLDAAAHVSARGNRCDETNSVDAVVQCRADSGWPNPDFECSRADDREREKPVCNRGSDRAFALGPFLVHVDPLIIAGATCEFVDALLIHVDPLRHPELTPDEPVYRGKTERFAKHDDLAVT